MAVVVIGFAKEEEEDIERESPNDVDGADGDAVATTGEKPTTE